MSQWVIDENQWKYKSKSSFEELNSKSFPFINIQNTVMNDYKLMGDLSKYID